MICSYLTMSNSWKKSDLQDLPGNPLFRGDERLSPYSGDVALTAQPDAVIRSRDPQDLSEALAYCHAHRIPVTFSGGRSGITGAAATSEGVLIATELRDKVLDIRKDKNGHSQAIIEPGARLGDLKGIVKEHGYFYPPDPTSYQEACLGGTVATNATGEDSLRYGPTRKYIRSIKVIKADGSRLELTRPLDDRPPETKGTAGYTRREPLIDLMIGSEGTLAYFEEITVDLLPEPGEHWAAIGFFPSLVSAIQFVQSSLESNTLSPRALEFMDQSSLEILKSDPEVPAIPSGAQFGIYWKQEYESETKKNKNIEAWMTLLNSALKDTEAKDLSEQIWVAQSETEQLRFRHWRHLIPSAINERVSAFQSQGGGKTASDWWVPLKWIGAALEKAWQESKEANLETITFGHLGNGHPHINYIAKDKEEVSRAKELIRRQCARAVAWGGGVAGEHGIGKIYRDLLSLQHPSAVIEAMKKLKKEWDPHWILGRETLFQSPDSGS